MQHIPFHSNNGNDEDADEDDEGDDGDADDNMPRLGDQGECPLS